MIIPETKITILFKFLSTENGGRKNGLTTGYRPNVVFNFTEEMLNLYKTVENGYFLPGEIRTLNADVMFIFTHDRWIQPGEIIECKIGIYNPGGVSKFFIPGNFLFAREGGRIIGIGNIISAGT